jgi:hypothetical protein
MGFFNVFSLFSRFNPREVASNGDDLALIRLPTLAVTIDEVKT